MYIEKPKVTKTLRSQLIRSNRDHRFTTQELLEREFKQNRAAFIDFFIQLKVNFCVTHIFNIDDLSIGSGTKKMGHFFYNLERKLFNTKYPYKLPKPRRLIALCYPEHLDSNLHFHSLIVVPPKCCSLMELYSHRCWNKLVPSGQVEVRRIRTVEETFKASTYSIKDIWKERNYESFVLSSQFWKY